MSDILRVIVARVGETEERCYHGTSMMALFEPSRYGSMDGYQDEGRWERYGPWDKKSKVCCNLTLLQDSQ